MHSVNLGAIVGGAVGGFVVLTMITTILLCVRRRKHKQQTTERGLEPKPLVFDSTSLGGESPILHPITMTSTPYILTPTMTPSPNIATSHDLTGSTIDMPINTHYSRSGAEVKQLPPVIRSPLQPGAAITTHQPTTSLAAHDAPAARLTSEQADFVNDLRRANVPAADIAVVMERMRAEAEGHGQSGGRGGEMGLRAAPPGYDGIDP